MSARTAAVSSSCEWFWSKVPRLLHIPQICCSSSRHAIEGLATLVPPLRCRYLVQPCPGISNRYPDCNWEVAEAPGLEDASSTAGYVQLALAELSRLRWLQELQIMWPGEPLGVVLPAKWLQPGVWPALIRCAATVRVVNRCAPPACSTSAACCMQVGWCWCRTTLSHSSLLCRLALVLPTRLSALPLPDIPPGVWPALKYLSLHLWYLHSTLPRSWGTVPHVLPALRYLSLQLKVQGGLPPEWARGFRHMRSLQIVDTESGPAKAGRAGSGVAGAAITLPPEWAAGFKQLESVSIAGMGLTGPIPPAWLQPGSFPALVEL